MLSLKCPDRVFWSPPGVIEPGDEARHVSRKNLPQGLALASESIRSESLAVHLSRNRFFISLGSNANDRRLLDYWRTTLDDHVHHFADHPQTEANIMFKRYGPYGAGSPGTGGFCVGEPLRKLTGMMQDAGGYDGAVLLSFVETLLHDEVRELERRVHDCAVCGRGKMVARTRRR